MYQTPPLRRLINRRQKLIDLHLRGEYLDVDTSKLDFKLSAMKRKHSSELGPSKAGPS